jgi:hypothetical protein
VVLRFALLGTKAVILWSEFAGVNFLFDEKSINIVGHSSGAAGCANRVPDKSDEGGGSGGCGGG